MSEVSLKEFTPEVKKAVKELPAAYNGSEIVSMVEKQKRRGLSAALATDIDNTFRRKDTDLAIDAQSKTTTFQLAQEANDASIPIVTVTGVDYPGVFKRMESGDLPYVPAIAASVGTELWIAHKDNEGKTTYKKDENFSEQFVDEKSPRYYPRKEIVQKADALIGSSKSMHPERDLQFQHPTVEEAYLNGQPADIQPFKTSFYVYATDEHTLTNIREDFENQFRGQRTVICEEIGYNQDPAHRDEARKKYCIDVLPVTKADVVNYLQDILGIDAMAVAGDSGNDKDMLTGAGNLAVRVGGAKRELVETIEHATQDAEGSLSMKKVRQLDGKEKYYYEEQGANRGPESLLRGSKLLLRALRRFGEINQAQMANNILSGGKR